MRNEERHRAVAQRLMDSARKVAMMTLVALSALSVSPVSDAKETERVEGAAGVAAVVEAAKPVSSVKPAEFVSSTGVKPVLPGAEEAHSRFDEAWPQTGRDWMRLDRDVDLRVKRMTLSELDVLMKKAEEGAPLAQTMLGLVFREGTDRSALSGAGATGGLASLRSNMDNAQALKWLGKAAEQGYPMAQAEIGEMYYRGHGVMRDIDQAIAWTELAARVDYPRAQLNLVQMKLFKATETADPEKTLEGIKGLAGEAINAIRGAGSASGMR